MGWMALLGASSLQTASLYEDSLTRRFSIKRDQQSTAVLKTL